MDRKSKINRSPYLLTVINYHETHFKPTLTNEISQCNHQQLLGILWGMFKTYHSSTDNHHLTSWLNITNDLA